SHRKRIMQRSALHAPSRQAHGIYATGRDGTRLWIMPRDRAAALLLHEPINTPLRASARVRRPTHCRKLVRSPVPASCLNCSLSTVRLSTVYSSTVHCPTLHCPTLHCLLSTLPLSTVHCWLVALSKRSLLHGLQCAAVLVVGLGNAGVQLIAHQQHDHVEVEPELHGDDHANGSIERVVVGHVGEDEGDRKGKEEDEQNGQHGAGGEQLETALPGRTRMVQQGNGHQHQHHGGGPADDAEAHAFQEVIVLET